MTHRSAAAFVDAEARLFLQDAPLGPGDRVLAGLSVAFDASCEEMWLAWRHGACLVPAPRSLVRSGEDLAPWLVRQAITVVSTVPTLAAMWPTDSIENVRLLIFGGEACPPELADPPRRRRPRGLEHVRPDRGDGRGVRGAARRRRAGAHRPAARRLGARRRRRRGRARRRGRDGRAHHRRRRPRALPRPREGRREVRARCRRSAGSARTARATSSGSTPRDSSSRDAPTTRSRSAAAASSSARSRRRCRSCPASPRAAAAVRTTEAGVPVLVGYLVVRRRTSFDRGAARAALARAAARRRSCRCSRVVDELPVRTSGKVDRAALPWPLPGRRGAGWRAVTGTEAWLAEQWQAVLGMPVPGRSADFFDLGGGSLAAAQLVSRIRARVPEFSVADIYDVPRLGAMAKALGAARRTTDARRPSTSPSRRRAPRSGCRRSSAFRCSSSPASDGCSTCSRRARCCSSCPASRCCPTAPLWVLARRAR